MKPTTKTRNWSIFLLLLILTLIPLDTFGKSTLKSILDKHALSPTEGRTLKAVLIQDRYNLKEQAGQLQWIMAASDKKEVNTSEYMQYESVGKILSKNRRLFSSLLKLLSNYEKTVVRLDEIYEKSMKLFKKDLPSERATRVKYKILIKIRPYYKSLKSDSKEIYSQAVKVEKVLTQLYEPVQDAYSFSVINKIMANEFADSFRPNKLKLEDKELVSGLEDVEKEMRALLEKSERVYNDALKNLGI